MDGKKFKEYVSRIPDDAELVHLCDGGYACVYVARIGERVLRALNERTLVERHGLNRRCVGSAAVRRPSLLLPRQPLSACFPWRVPPRGWNPP